MNRLSCNYSSIATGTMSRRLECLRAREGFWITTKPSRFQHGPVIVLRLEREDAHEAEGDPDLQEVLRRANNLSQQETWAN